MKKYLTGLLAAAALMTLSSFPALAAEGLNARVTAAYKDTGTITVSTVGTDRVLLTYSGSTVTNGRQYMVTAQADGGTEATPTADNLIYIDQAAASDSQVSFTIYPKTMEEDATYSIYLSSNSDRVGDITKYTQVALFGLGLPDDFSDILLGDVNNSGTITAADASLVLDYVVSHSGAEADGGSAAPTERELASMDMNHSGTITAADASLILDYVVNQTTAQ